MAKRRKSQRGKRGLLGLAAICGVAGFFLIDARLHHQIVIPTPPPKIEFDTSVTQSEKDYIVLAVKQSKFQIKSSLKVQASVSASAPASGVVFNEFVPVMNQYTIPSGITTASLVNTRVVIALDTPPQLRTSLATSLGLKTDSLLAVADVTTDLRDHRQGVGFIPAKSLSANYKLMSLDGHYYLDEFSAGALFRTVTFSGPESDKLTAIVDAKLANQSLGKSTVLKVNMSGVTALTRGVLQKIDAVGDPGWPARRIAAFLKDADIVHTSNEVSFKDNCLLSNTVFCAKPSYIKALEDSGINLVELTGNHNNDSGFAADSATLGMYKDRGWGTFGGGANETEAAKPYETTKKATKLAFFGYNYYDTIHRSVALADPANPGANEFSFDKIKSDIAAAKAKGEFVIVDLQYQECYSYPDTYVLMPSCYKPVSNPDQKADFRKVIDLGADMVIGTQAHQPQTFEFYKGKPIYYGTGNLFFDQFQWPGTEQGIISSHYFFGGKLLQTKLSPTVYDTSFQPRLMNDVESQSFLKYLSDARP